MDSIASADSACKLELSHMATPPEDIMSLIYDRCRPDSWLAFGRRRSNKSGAPLAVKADVALQKKDLDELLPAVLTHCIGQTHYMMPNTLNERCLPGGVDYEAFQKALGEGHHQYFFAKNEHVQELNALVVDLDVGRDDGISAPVALGYVMERCQAGKLPWLSLAALSGRGAYCLWLLKDNGPDRAPPLNTPENRHLWKLCLTELLHRTRDLKSDMNAQRLANWFKRPGTTDHKTGNEVVYLRFGVNNIEEIPLYRLQDIADKLDVKPTPRVERKPESPYVPLTSTPNPGLKGKRNPRQPTRSRIRDLELLCQSRRGIREGHRHKYLMYYHNAVRRDLLLAYKDEPDRFAKANWEAREQTVEMAKKMDPPYPWDEAKYACAKYVHGRVGIPNNNTIAKNLDVTREEAIRLGLTSVIPPDLAVERRQADQAKTKANRDRREAIDELLAKGWNTARIVREIAKVWPGDHNSLKCLVKRRRARRPQTQGALFKSG